MIKNITTEAAAAAPKSRFVVEEENDEFLTSSVEAEAAFSQSFVDLSNNLRRSQSSRHVINAINRSRLNWAALRLQGRDRELELLQRAYESISSDTAATNTTTPTEIGNPNEQDEFLSDIMHLSAPAASSTAGVGIIFVTGAAGTGKTALIRQAYEDKAWFVATKYNQLCSSATSSTTTLEIFSRLGTKVATEADDATLLCLQRDLTHTLVGSGSTDKDQHSLLQTFFALVPGVIPLFFGPEGALPPQYSSHYHEKHVSNSGSNGCSLDALTTVLRKLLECICKHLDDPIVLFFDDVQWSDAGTFELLESLLEGHDITKLVLVAAYRNEEEQGRTTTAAEDSSSSTPPLQEFVSKQVQKKHSLVDEILQLHNLTSTNVAQLIGSLTKVTRLEQVQPLADLVTNRTGGCAFFVLEFLKELERTKLLQFSTDSFRYEWDVAQIKAETNVCANIADLQTLKLHSMPEHVVRIITVSSILGSNFLVDVLASVMCINSESLDTMDSVVDALEYAEEQGMMEAIESKAGLRYKFVHDCLQQLAYDLVGEDQKATVHWQVGWALYISRDRSDSHKFLAVEHLNTAVQMGAPNTMGAAKLAKLNVTTANEARLSYAFVPARSYLLTAMEILKSENPWENYYDMMLEITALLVKLDTGLGKFDSAHELIQVGIQKARTSLDAFPFSLALVVLLQCQDHAEEAVDVAIQALRTLGTKVRSHVSTPRFLYKVLKMRRRLKALSDEEILGLPDMASLEVAHTTMDAMSSLTIALYQVGREEAGFYIGLQQIELQLKHGLAAAHCFCQWGYACLSLNDPEEAYRYVMCCSPTRDE